MYLKKILFITFFVLFTSVSVFSHDVGIVGTYNPFNPSFWSIGVNAELTVLQKSNGNRTILGGSISFGKASYEYVIPNSEQIEQGYLKESYLQEDFFFDMNLNFIYQINVANVVGIRLGINFPILFSYAFMKPDYDDTSYTFYGYSDNRKFPQNFGFGVSGIVGLSLFPQSKFSYKLDAYPGLVFLYAREGIGFIIPIHFCANMKIGK